VQKRAENADEQLPWVNSGPTISAAVVARWKAPEGGGMPGRRAAKRQVGGENAYVKALAEGKACCANVVWFD
jgi:hypothetical protein